MPARSSQQPAPPWNPYIAGALTGLAIALALLLSNESFGALPLYAYLSKGIKIFLEGRSLGELDPYGRPLLRLNWQVLFTLGIPLGAWLGAVLYNDFRWQSVPPLWRRRFGPDARRRAIWAFVGGFIALFGTRIAMGCPSGLGLSGMVLLSIGGFVGMAAFFAGGLLMAQLIYRGRLDRGEQ